MFGLTLFFIRREFFFKVCCFTTYFAPKTAIGDYFSLFLAAGGCFLKAI
jgi:hypothetical protein